MAELNPPNQGLPQATDVLVVGAGPAAMWAVFQLGLLDLRACMVDALPHLGGQVQQLYADKVLYDVPGIRQCTGAELVESLWCQVRPLCPGLALNQLIQSIEREGDGWRVQTDRGLITHARSIIIASGVGAFAPRRIKAVDFQDLEGRCVHYHPPQGPLPKGLTHAVCGNGPSAVELAVTLAEQSEDRPVWICFRRDAFEAPAEWMQRFEALREQGRIRLKLGMIQGYSKQGTRLVALHVMQTDGQITKPDVDHLWVMQGISPQVGPVAQWGLALERRSLLVDPCTMATSEAGIHAIGDAVQYPNKRKLLVSAFHEATQAAYAIADALHPSGLGPQEYTTSSARLQEKLTGVAKRAKNCL